MKNDKWTKERISEIRQAYEYLSDTESWLICGALDEIERLQAELAKHAWRPVSEPPLEWKIYDVWIPHSPPFAQRAMFNGKWCVIGVQPTHYREIFGPEEAKVQ